jgi:hypothetical protein
MAGRHTDPNGSVHESAGFAKQSGRFVPKEESEQPANVMERRSQLLASRTGTAIMTAELHIEDGFTAVRSSWATGHSGSKSDQVYWARHALDRAVVTQGEAVELAGLLGDKKTYQMQQKLDANALEIEKLERWIGSADEYAKSAVEKASALQATFDARKAETAGPDGSIDHPVKHDDPRLTAGEVFDTVETADGRVFHRRRDGVFPDAPYAFRIQVDRQIDSEDLSKMAKILGSAYATTGWNEGLGWPEQDTPFSFIVSADTTKGRAYQNLDNMEVNLAAYFVDGSPVAKTNRGRTPKGERFVDGFGTNAPKFELYYEGAPFISEP